jgi:hypothetical protein
MDRIGCQRLRIYGFKDIFIGKLSIPKSDEEFYEVSKIAKKMLRSIELNEIAFTEFILSMDVKIAFKIVKGLKNKDYPDENADNAWEKLNDKYVPVSSPSIFKLDKQFRKLSLKKGQHPEF